MYCTFNLVWHVSIANQARFAFLQLFAKKIRTYRTHLCKIYGIQVFLSTKSRCCYNECKETPQAISNPVSLINDTVKRTIILLIFSRSRACAVFDRGVLRNL